MSELRILIADDHELMRRGVRSLLEAEAGWKVVGEAADGQELVEKTEKLRPDVVVLDISMPRLNGLEAAHRIKKILPEVKILMHGSSPRNITGLKASDCTSRAAAKPRLPVEPRSTCSTGGQFATSPNFGRLASSVTISFA